VVQCTMKQFPHWWKQNIPNLMQSDCCLDGRCWASSQVEIMAPTMLNAEMLDLDSMLWEVQEYSSVQRRLGMTDMRNVDFCNWSLVFNHCHSWGIRLPSFLSLHSFIDSPCAAAMKHRIHTEGVLECFSGFLLYTIIYGCQHHA